MEGAKYQVRVEGIDSMAFSVKTKLNLGNALYPLLFNIALDKVV